MPKWTTTQTYPFTLDVILMPNRTYFCYPDATGAARNSSAQFSDISLLKKHFQVKVKHINPRVVNRVNAMNKALSGNMIIDPRCKTLINDSKPKGKRLLIITMAEPLNTLIVISISHTKFLLLMLMLPKE